MRLNTYLHVMIAAVGLLIGGIAGQAASILPPQFVPGDKAIRPAAGDQTAPEIAAGGSVTLAVWQDKRALPGSLLVPSFEWETSSDIYAVRIDANGKLLDRVPIPVAQEAAMQNNPQVVWNGTNWLVFFGSVDINGTGFYYQNSLEAVRVSPSGAVLDPTPIKTERNSRRILLDGGERWSRLGSGLSGK